MEKNIIKLAKFATTLTPPIVELDISTAYYSSLEEYIIANPQTEEADLYHQIMNTTGGMSILISRIFIELALKDFVSNGITPAEAEKFNKIQKEYQSMITIYQELNNKAENITK